MVPDVAPVEFQRAETGFSFANAIEKMGKPSILQNRKKAALRFAFFSINTSLYPASSNQIAALLEKKCMVNRVSQFLEECSSYVFGTKMLL